MNCDEARDLIGPFADGELGASERRIVERHIGECAGCRSELAALEALSVRLRGTAARPALPADLETRIRAALAAEERQVLPAPSRRDPRLGRRAIGTHLAALVAGGALAASVLLIAGRPAAPDLAEQVLATHVGAMLSDEFGSVASSDSHTVKPWFAGKLDFSPPVVDLAADGFPLLAGRVDYLAGRPVAVLDYARGAHRISLFVMPAGRRSGAGDR